MRLCRSTMLKLLCALVLLGPALAGCAGNDEKNGGDSANAEEEDQQKAVAKLYRRAASALDNENYKKAEKRFQKVERQFPYSKWATQAQLMAAFSAYKDLRYEEALQGVKRFIELHPGSDKLAYAHYLKALSHYERISDVQRDQARSRKARDALNTLIKRFPESKYVRDARLKRDLVNDHLAGKHMSIGRYYLKKGQVNAAIGRFTDVIKNYETTSHTPEALYRLVESYLKLGVDDQARRAAAVLGHNFPGSEWYEDAYQLLDPKARKRLKQNRSWMDKTIDSLLDSDDGADETDNADDGESGARSGSSERDKKS